jgi:hypothetical protein
VMDEDGWWRMRRRPWYWYEEVEINKDGGVTKSETIDYIIVFY